jgi:heme-degrading monooxygenase HmoA
MIEPPKGSIAVIFVSLRTGVDEPGYGAAAAEMEATVKAMPGYLGMDSARSADGVGITISYWRDEESVAGWRDHQRHSEIRGRGRSHWYDWYRVIVARVDRTYAWTR